MARFHTVEDQILKRAYADEVAEKTLKIGKLTFLIGLPILLLFTVQDIMMFKTTLYVPWRMVGIIAVSLFGVLSFTLFKKKSSLIVTFQSISMVGIVIMMCGVIYETFTHTEIATEFLKSGTATGYLYALFATFAVSGGARKYIGFVLGVPTVIMCAALALSGQMGEGDWGYLSNAIPIALVVVILARVQGKMAYKEFRMRKMLEFREEELKEEISRRRKVEEELVLHQEHLEKLVAQRTQELRDTNKELIISKEKAEEMNLLKSHFLNNMSHEIRTPINGILGIAQVLEFETDIEEVQSYSGILLESGQRLFRTLTSILNLSKLESEKTEIYLQIKDLKPIVEEEVSSLMSQAEAKNISLEFAGSDTPMMAAVDEEMIQQTLYFIVENAIKFTHQGGVKVICDSAITASGTNGISIKVTDTGIGMDKEFMNQLFEPFRQESNGKGRAFEGSGLGLSLAKKFTHLLGGDISVESEKGKGTTFEILLPEKQFEMAQ